MFSELPNGAATAETITLPSNSIYFPGMVEWDSKRRKLVVGDQSCGNCTQAAFTRLRSRIK